MLETLFKELLRSYTPEIDIAADRWKDIVDRYSEPHRYYHTLTHLDNFLIELLEIKAGLENWNAMLFALCYHDVIYDPLRSDNEEQSAMLAKERMTLLGVPESTIGLAVTYIMATRSHKAAMRADINYFTDADLSILGQASDIYVGYSSDIRKEYAVYPDAVYWPARKKVLIGFLQMEQIFKTGFFYTKYEAQARKNISAELASIG